MPPFPLKSSKSKHITGVIEVPGDKSISHRSLMLSAIAIGTAKISGILAGDDVIATKRALQRLGVTIEQFQDYWQVSGVGVGGLQEPDNVLDMGNSGTGARLMMGLLAPYNFNSIFTGDASLCLRPMQRVITPLSKMGARFITRSGQRMPLTLIGSNELVPITYELPVASAQVKSAIILAALNTPGTTTIIEPEATRDHTELMLRGLGAEIIVSQQDKKRHINVTSYPNLKAMDIKVPGDPSSAAFVIVAAIITPDSEITVKNVCINPHRIGLYSSLQLMGADITIFNQRTEAGEVIADITAKSSRLKGAEIPAEIAPFMIDEYPILAIAAANAEGKTTMLGLAELKVKESNRLQAIYDGLTINGIKCEIGNDSLTVYGGKIPGGATVLTHMDHRIAMSFLILGLVAENDIIVDDGFMINTSFPGFMQLMNQCGANIECMK